MSRTLVIQSHRSPLPYAWIEECLHSVRDWCRMNTYEYRFLGDELFSALPTELVEKTRKQRVIASDLARLRVLQAALKEGFERVIWLDADVLIFNPAGFVLPDESAAVGREVWVQNDRNGRLKVYKKVHNAFLMFRSDTTLLDFYNDTATRLLLQNEGSVSPQFIGPKFLTALHNVANLPVLESAGMLCPMVIRDLLEGAGPALRLFADHSREPVSAVNLCASSCDNRQVTVQQMKQLIALLISKNASFLL